MDQSATRPPSSRLKRRRAGLGAELADGFDIDGIKEQRPMIDGFLERTTISAAVTATSKRQALCVVAEIAGRAFGLKAGRILDALLEREAIAPTGVGKGVAVPHAQIEGMGAIRAVFVRLTKAVEFGAVDDQPVDLIFAIFAPAGATSDHLRALARVSRLLRRNDIRERLRLASGPDAIHALLGQEVQSSAA